MFFFQVTLKLIYEVIIILYLAHTYNNVTSPDHRILLEADEFLLPI